MQHRLQFFLQRSAKFREGMGKGLRQNEDQTDETRFRKPNQGIRSTASGFQALQTHTATTGTGSQCTPMISGLHFWNKKGRFVFTYLANNADHNRSDGCKGFVMCADEKLTVFLELESAIRDCSIGSKLSLQRGPNFREEMGNGLRFRITQNDGHEPKTRKKIIL